MSRCGHSHLFKFSAPCLSSAHCSPNCTMTNTEMSIERDSLPKSVRGAAPELRALIRKKQNAESARRCRLKLRLQRQLDAERDTQQSLPLRLNQLTMLVTTLHRRIAAIEEVYTSLLARNSAAPRVTMDSVSICTETKAVKPICCDRLGAYQDSCNLPTSPTDISMPFFVENTFPVSKATTTSFHPSNEHEDFSKAVDELALL